MRFDSIGYLYSSNRYSWQRVTTTLQRLFGAYIRLEFGFYRMVQDIFVGALSEHVKLEEIHNLLK
jgi:hypothetical protein